jgi:hypothetical protein
LYGNNFRTASDDEIKSAITILDPPMISNIIAMEAPKYGKGEYTRSTISKILSVAYTGFVSAKYETTSVDEKLKTVIHTGNWGTGAYGGNKEIMAILQILAAHLAEVDTLVYHSHKSPEDYENGLKFLSNLGEINTIKIIEAIEKQGYKWGQSDGQ